MARERDWLEEVCLMGLNEIALRGRGGVEAERIYAAVEDTLRPEHVTALIEFLDVCHARLEMRRRVVTTNNQTEGRVQ